MSERLRLLAEDHARKVAEHAKATGDRAYRPSNGTEGEMFMERWCFRCTKDDYEAGRYCEIIARTMALDRDGPDYPGHWIYGDDGQPRCTAFNRDWSTP